MTRVVHDSFALSSTYALMPQLQQVLWIETPAPQLATLARP